MSITVFISATRHDLEDDLLEAVKEAITHAGGQPVDMDGWDNDYELAMQVCEQKLEASSHYIGVFGYRRGWVPDERMAANTEFAYDQSITEYEFWLACENSKPMAVFMPKEPSFVENMLKEREENSDSPQSTDAAREQEAFRNRVAGNNRAFTPFHSEASLYYKTNRRAKVWIGGGVRAAQRRSGSKQVDLSKLGRKGQEDAFDDALDELRDGDRFPPVAFVLHGPNGNGHAYAAKRLRQLLEDSANSWVPLHASADASWQEGGVQTLLEELEAGLSGEEEEAPSVASIAAELVATLAENPVVLTIERIQRFGTGCASLREEFWEPLLQVLPDRLENRLVLVLTLEEDAAPQADTAIAADDVDIEDHDPTKLISLPRLGEIEEDDLVRWFRDRGLTKTKATAEASTLLQETDGEPAKILLQLMTPPI